MVDPSPAAVRNQFLIRYFEDLDAGITRSMEDYQGLFPGRETEVARAFGELHAEPPTLPPSGASHGEDLPRKVGRFVIERVVGRGGQGVVYLAWDPELRRRVALKILTAGLLDGGEARSRFRREAEAASRLDHPGICAVHELGEDRGHAYIAMQYVEGRSLAAHLEEARGQGHSLWIHGADEGDETSGSSRPGSSWRETCSILELVERVARAAHYAHEAGIVHRDLKPANLLVAPDGHPVILDFGLARDETLDGPSLTQSGDRFGTPAYMPPEQLEGDRHRIDRRSDVYALGVTLYECLTLHRPFEAPSREALYRSILSEAPRSVRSIRSGLPRDLEVVLAKALAKEGKHRFATALELAEELARIRRHEPILTRPPGSLLKLLRWSQRNPRLAGSLGLLFVVLTVGLAVTSVLFSRARSALQDFDSVALAAKLDAAEAELDTLLPVRPALLDVTAAWLEDHAVPIERDRSVLRGVLGRLGTEDLSPGDAFLRETLAGIESRLEGFTLLVARVREDLSWAALVRERTLEAHEREWEETIEEISRCPLYRGLSLGPQLGLIPLGPDPASGLHEFYHLRSAAPGAPLPRRDPRTGRLVVTGETGLVFVLLPGGPVTLGAQQEDPAALFYDRWFSEDDRALHDGVLDPFFLSKYELTQGQWLRLTGQPNPSEYPAGTLTPDCREVTLAHPVDQGISFLWENEARECRRFGFRIPTEDEWEFACRGATTTSWYTGDTVESLQGFENLADWTSRIHVPTWRQDWPLPFADEHVIHAPVGSFGPNPFGLHDMLGNVQEMARANSRSWRNYAWRGGSFRTGALRGRVGSRRFVGADHGSGLRLARSLDSEGFQREGLPIAIGDPRFESGDLDGDGFADVVCFCPRGDQVLLNGGDGVLGVVEGSLPAGKGSWNGALLDLDQDGDLDLVCIPAGGNRSSDAPRQNRLLLNSGAGRFVDETSSRAPRQESKSQDLAAGDFDGDGLIDLAIGNSGDDRGERNRLWRNAGQGNFDDVTEGRLPGAPPGLETEDRTGAIEVADLDGDGDLDLVCGNWHYEHQNRVYLNDGTGRFVDATRDCLPVRHLDHTGEYHDITLSVALGDVDSDGDQDLVCGNGWGTRWQRNRMYLNDGAGRFRDVSEERLPPDRGRTNSVALADVDGDQDLDLITAGSPRSRLYLNEGGGVFRDVTVTHLPWLQGRDQELVDLDGDRDLDLVGRSSGHVFFFRNQRD